jgi:hypothetical protein
VAADEGEISSLGNREKSQVCRQKKWNFIAASSECGSEKLYCFLMTNLFCSANFFPPKFFLVFWNKEIFLSKKNFGGK